MAAPDTKKPATGLRNIEPSPHRVERKRPTEHGAADRKPDFNQPEETPEPLQQLQAGKLRRLYAVSFATSVTIARLEYAVLP